MKSASLKFCVTALMFACASTAFAQSRFIWTDENGRKVFSDTPPPISVPRSKILKGADELKKSSAASPQGDAPDSSVAKAPGSDTPRSAQNDSKSKAPMTLAERDAESRKNAKAAADKAVKEQETASIAKAKTERCSQLRAAARSLDTGARVVTVDAKGERKVMEDDERAATLARYNGELARDCK